MFLFDTNSGVVDSKVGWGSKKWPCMEPKHYTQQDGYNCGVIVCWVSLKLYMIRAQEHYRILT